MNRIWEREFIFKTCSIALIRSDKRGLIWGIQKLFHPRWKQRLASISNQFAILPSFVCFQAVLREWCWVMVSYGVWLLSAEGKKMRLFGVWWWSWEELWWCREWCWRCCRGCDRGLGWHRCRWMTPMMWLRERDGTGYVTDALFSKERHRLRHRCRWCFFLTFFFTFFFNFFNFFLTLFNFSLKFNYIIFLKFNCITFFTFIKINFFLS